MTVQRSIAIPFAIACIGIASFTAMDAFMKGLSIAIGAYNATLWRTIAGSLLGGALFVATGHRLPARSTFKLHMLRGGVAACMAVLWFWGLARVPMAEAIALSFYAPLMAIYLASLWLGEKVRPQALLGSLLALAGVALIMAVRAQSGAGDPSLLGAIAILCSAFLYAINLVLMRKQAQLASPIEVGFFQNLTCCLFLLLAAPFFGAAPDASHAAAITLALLSLMLLSWAYARAEAQSLVSVEYTGFGWGALFGWLAYGEALGWWVIAGAALIVLGCWIAVRAPRKPAEVTLEATL